MRRWLKWAAVVLAVIVGLGIIYSALFLRFANVPTGSMKNTILIGDHIVSNILFGKIQRGDVILFKYPANPSVIYIKRVIGLPGERIQLQGDKIIINGKELPERRVYVKTQLASDETADLEAISREGAGGYEVYYQREPGKPSPDGADNLIIFGGAEAYPIPQNEYFVLGDNRDNSEDSRFYGTIPARLIVGKPFLIYWSNLNGRTRWSRILSKIR